MSDIFDSLDRLMRDITIVNEAKEEKEGTAEVEINDACRTSEQARKAVRSIFARHYFKEDVPEPPEGPETEEPESEEPEEEWPDPPMEMDGIDLPNPFDDSESSSGAGPGHTFGDDFDWDKDSELDKLLSDAESLADEDDTDDEEPEEPDIDDDLFDDFGEEKDGKGSGEGSGSGDDDDTDDLDDIDDTDEDEGGEDGSGKSGKSGKDGDDSGDADGEDGEDGEGEDTEGKDGETGKSGKERGEPGEETGETGETGSDGEETEGEEGEEGEGEETEDGKSGKSGKTGKSGKSGTDGDPSGEEKFTGDDIVEPGGDPSTKSTKGKDESEGKEGTEGTDGSESGEGSDKDYEDFKDELKKALKRAGKSDGTEDSHIEDLADSLDKLGDTKSKSTSEKMKELRKEIDRKVETPSTPIGSMMGETTDEDLKKELEDHGYSGDDVAANSEAKNAKTPIPTEKEEQIREKAMEGFEKRSKGTSKISKSILYKALKNRSFTEGVWDELIEKIIKDKSKKSGKEDNKHKTIRFGNKNQLWRGAVLPTFKSEPGREKKKIYCFVDWSGSVTGVNGLIESFLGKVLHVSEKLDYGDMDVYGFGDRLSLPRTITKEMREKDGLATVLSDTRSYMDSQRLGGSIENFSKVAHEINIIKSKDDEGIIFIFGDGIWTFYGNSQPPIRLKEICPEYRDDIFAFVFYDKSSKDNSYWWDYILKEIAVLVDPLGVGLGSDHVIVAPLEDIS